ncbi:glycosyltransferase family 4 protein [Actinoplanes sp. N902-109]|uniref:glycosyltransferase family 4 protein n=1 Tax=Actinoplanes sp. (strain N902-109) TaxID=649831 RepID=UPI000329456B|nr:glycosyltransferase family 4 protein [Actinoplanes sp. N902-109]AGL20814.1 group 1 glycosyl transferase [Actinoplanes sp. N902-109]
MRHYRGGPGEHVVWLNFKDAAHPLAGGAEEYLHQVTARMASRGQRVTIITSRPRRAARTEQVKGVTVRRMGNAYTVYLLALLWLFRHRREIDAIVDTCNGIPFFSPLAVGKRVPVVVLIHHVHQVMFAQHFGFPMAQIGRWVERAGNRLVYGDRTIAVVSPSSRTEVRRVLGLIGPVHVAANGQEPLHVPRAERAAVPRIVCVGRLAPHKRWDLVLRALSRVAELVPDVELHLVGDGPCRAELTALVHELDLADRVTLHGRLGNGPRNRLLASGWLTVCASEVEGWGLAVTEAMSLGVPAVVLASPGLRDSVRNRQTGWVVSRPQHLAGQLTSALIELEDRDTAALWARRCRAWAGRFTWDATADRMMGLLAAEDARRVSADNRVTCDLSTVVDLPVRLATRIDYTRLRDVDQVDWDQPDPQDPGAMRVRVLLSGYDEGDATALLNRLGVATDPAVTWVWVARPADLLGWKRAAGSRAGDLRPYFAECAAVGSSRP